VLGFLDVAQRSHVLVEARDPQALSLPVAEMIERKHQRDVDRVRQEGAVDHRVRQCAAHLGKVVLTVLRKQDDKSRLSFPRHPRQPLSNAAHILRDHQIGVLADRFRSRPHVANRRARTLEVPEQRLLLGAWLAHQKDIQARKLLLECLGQIRLTPVAAGRS
jgi:hypothetical protein